MTWYLKSQRYVQIIMTFTAGLLLLAVPAFAQTESGNVHGRVVDVQNQPVPGVTVTLSGIGAPQTFVTHTNGSFRFLNVDPGRYTIAADLSGFAPVSRPVEVNVGRNSDVELKLSLSAAEAITVSAETPLIDVRKSGTGQNVTEIEMQEVPTARDPWVVLQTIPGILMSTVNVGGNASGQQSSFVSKGTTSGQTEWNIDGVATQDMDSTGSTWFYYDFNSFQEFQVSTASSDPAKRTPGVQINMVTKRGENDYKGEAHWFWTDQSFQEDPVVPAEAVDYLDAVNSLDHIDEYGAEFGGPILRDRLWFWGAYAHNDIKNIPAGEGATRKTDLINWTGKVNAQVIPANTATVFYTWTDKRVKARGLGPRRPLETARNQTGPGDLLKLEDTHMFSSNFYLTGFLSRMYGYYQQIPIGGMDVAQFIDEDDIPQRSYRASHMNGPQQNHRLDGSYFFDTSAWNHELKFGAGYRKTVAEWEVRFPGNGAFGIFSDRWGDPSAGITRDAFSNYSSDYYDLYAGDTVLLGNLTLTAGVRYDFQAARNDPSKVPASQVLPDLMPAIDFAGDERDLEWTNISPRLGATYALGSNKKTVLRASYNRYADQLGSSDAGFASAFYLPAYLYFYWDDSNGDKNVQREELDFDYGPFAPYYFDPDNPTATTSTLRLDYDMKAPTTNELLLGVEHEILTGFTLGLNFTHRIRDNVLWTQYEKTQGMGDYYTKNDFEQASTITVTMEDGSTFTTPNYRIKRTLPSALYRVYRNRPNYSQKYQGLELTGTKRMANRWMMRGNVTLSRWTQESGEGSYVDPTIIRGSSFCTPCDGGVVSSGGVNSRWSYALTGLYELPWNINFGLAMNGREGFLLPRYRRQNNRDGLGNKNILIGEYDDFRLPNVFNLDLRLAKEFAVGGAANVRLAVDLFNVTDERTILDRDPRLYNANWNHADNHWIEELQSPRIWRFSTRVQF